MFMHSVANGHLRNDWAATNTHVQILLQILFQLRWVDTEGHNCWRYGSSTFGKKPPAVLLGSCTTPCSRQWGRAPLAPPRRWHQMSESWLFAMLIVHLTLILTCTSLVTYSVPRLFLHVFVVRVPSLGRCQFRSSEHFLMGFLTRGVTGFLYIPDSSFFFYF